MRLDKYLTEKYGSRTKAATAISKGLVTVNGVNVQPSYNLKDTDTVCITEAEENYVSVGGFKLRKAIKDFDYLVEGKVFADIGASTGGFTDCLLQNNAKKVYCIDIGESQLDKSLLCDKIEVIDNYNARNLTKDVFKDKLDAVVIDVSFISLTLILPAVYSVLDDGADIIALIKPQFECESRKVGKNGIVRDKKMREKIVEKILNFSFKTGLIPLKLTTAPIVQGKNIEYLVLLKKGTERKNINNLLIKSIIL